VVINYLKNVTTLQLNAQQCIGCGICTEICPHRVLTIENKKAKIIDLDRCMECGGCAKNCPTSAITVRAGVGCAAAVIFSPLMGKKGGCSCGASAKKKLPLKSGDTAGELL
jgi:NAD-dependent dihydropyrimidine dehydrogenase PreA subunit